MKRRLLFSEIASSRVVELRDLDTVVVIPAVIDTGRGSCIKHEQVLVPA